MMKLINSQTKARDITQHRKARLKCSPMRAISNEVVFITLLLCAVNRVSCDDISRHNRPPRFIIDDHHSEIVVRLKEGPDTPEGSLIYKLKGYDPDGDVLEFGVQGTYDSDIITVKSLNDHEAGIYLEKELDREVRKEYFF
jgi:cadherin 23